MIVGIHHPGLTTQNMESMLDFYCGLLGFEKVFELEWSSGEDPAFDVVTGFPGSAARLCMLRAGSVYLELFDYRNPRGAAAAPNRRVNDVGITHVCVEVVDNVAEHQRLVEAGVTFIGPPQTVRGMVRVAYARDPDGNLVEFQEILDWRHPAWLDVPGPKRNEQETS